MAVKKKRQFNKISVVYVVFGITLITVMTIIGTSVFLRTKEIIVEGVSMYTAKEIVESSGLSAGDNLMFINTQNVSRDIRKSLPFVNTANITRILPDTILVEITESEATASISFLGDQIIIDHAGRVLARLSGADRTLRGVDTESLINIHGLEIEDAVTGNVLKPVFGTELKLQYVQDLLAALERDDMIKDVSYIDVSSIVNVYFGYIEQYRVIMGGSSDLRPSNIRNNLSRLLITVQEVQRIHPNTTGIINIVHESGQPKFTPT